MFRVDRALPQHPSTYDTKQVLQPSEDTKAKAWARLEYEAARRGQALPVIPDEPPERTRIAQDPHGPDRERCTDHRDLGRAREPHDLKPRNQRRNHMHVEHAKPRVGSVVTIDRDDFLAGKYADEIRTLLVERSALVFPAMHLDDEEQLQFASTIGEVFLVGDKALQNISLDPEMSTVADYTRGAFYWHIDGANDPVPAKATMLSVRTMPAEGEGGDTLVANTYAAYADLPDAEKQALEGIKVRHALEASQRYVNPTPSVAELTRWQSRPSQTHPLVWHHRHGRSSLVLGNTCFYVEDMELAEGNMLLCRLMEWATQEQYIYRHKWAEGDFLLFDNTGTMHRADWYPLDSKRLMRRTTLKGDEPVTACLGTRAPGQ